MFIGLDKAQICLKRTVRRCDWYVFALTHLPMHLPYVWVCDHFTK